MGNRASSLPKVSADALLANIKITELNDKGYINLPAAEFPIHVDFRTKSEEHKTGAYIRKERRIQPQPDVLAVHPIFARNGWPGLSRQDYDLLLPSLRLASRMLDEPSILPYLKGLLQKPLVSLNEPELERKVGQPLFSFETAELDDWALEETWKTLYDLRRSVWFKFRDLPDTVALTSSVSRTPSSLVKNGYSAAVRLHPDFLRVFRGEKTAAQVSTSWRPGPDHNSALLRTQFMFAVTLVHEVIHALWIATNPPYEKARRNITSKTRIPFEPFWRDHRMNELGSEWENQVFGGTIQPLGDPESVVAPYGLVSVPFPGGRPDWGGVNFSRGNPRKWGVLWVTIYPIDMKHIKSMFTNDAWDQVARFGVRKLRRQRKLGFRLYLSKSMYPLLRDDEPVKQNSPISSEASGSDDANSVGVVRRGEGAESPNDTTPATPRPPGSWPV